MQYFYEIDICLPAWSFIIENSAVVKLNSVKDAEHNYVRINPDEVYESVAKQVEWLQAYYGAMKSESESKYEYPIVRLHESILIARTYPGVKLGATLEGSLYPVPADVYWIAKDTVGDAKPVLPFMLDTTGTLGSNIRMLAYVAIPLILLSLFNMFRAFYRMLNLYEHPFFLKLKKFGPAEEIVQEINQDVTQGFTQVQDYYISSKWILRQDLYNLKVARNYFEKEAYDLSAVFK